MNVVSACVHVCVSTLKSSLLGLLTTHDAAGSGQISGANMKKHRKMSRLVSFFFPGKMNGRKSVVESCHCTCSRRSATRTCCPPGLHASAGRHRPDPLTGLLSSTTHAPWLLRKTTRHSNNETMQLWPCHAVRNLRVSHDHLPPTSAARTTSLALPAFPTSSG